jgi:uncharacterized protein (TIGR02145 family)
LGGGEVKFSKRLVAATVAALALFACDKDLENTLQTVAPETAVVSARLVAATAQDSALLRLTDSVIVTLDTGIAPTRVDSQVVKYTKGTVHLKDVWVGSNYILTYKGLVGRQVIWNGTVHGNAVSGTNAPQLKLDSAASIKLNAAKIAFDTAAAGKKDSAVISIYSKNDSAFHDTLYYSTKSATGPWTKYANPLTYARTSSIQIWAKDSIAGISSSSESSPVVIPAVETVAIPETDTLTSLANLTVNKGTMRPVTFDKDSLTYHLLLDAAESEVNVTATQAKGATQTIAIKEVAAASGVASTVAVNEVDTITVVVTNTNAQKNRTYTIAVLHLLKVPSIVTNLGTFTLSHNSTTKGTIYWRFAAATGDWQEYLTATPVSKDTTIEYLDSLVGQSSAVGSSRVLVTKKADTLKAPKATFTGTTGTGTNAYLGLVTLTLASNNGSVTGDVLQWRTDKHAWTDWTAEVTLYAGDGTTLYVRETRKGAVSDSAKTQFTVTPYHIAAPKLTLDVSAPGAVSVSAVSQATGLPIGLKPVLYYKVDGNGWKILNGLADASGLWFYAKDSLMGQVSTICSTMIAIPTAPTVLPAGNSGKSTGQVWVGAGSTTPSITVVGGKDILENVTITCGAPGSTAQYSTNTGTSWTIGGKHNQDSSGKVIYLCVDNVTGIKSTQVMRDFMLFQPPLVSVSDTTFADTLTVKVQTRQNAQYLQSCVGDTDACKMDSVFANSSNWAYMKGVTGDLTRSRDTLLSETTVLWTRSRLDDYVSHPTKRIFRKATSVTYEGQTYKTVKIGTQVWMAQNLNYRSTTGGPDTVGTCYMNSADSCKKYGRLYTWAEAMGVSSSYNASLLAANLPSQGICPKGWHIPSNAEWNVLELSVDSVAAATNLKSTSGWTGSGNGSDWYGFNALPAGNLVNGAYTYIGKYANFWTSSEQAENAANSESLSYGNPSPSRANVNKASGLSVRCLQD